MTTFESFGSSSEKFL